MSDDPLEKESERQRRCVTVIKRVWDALEADPATTTAPIWFDGPYWDSMEWDPNPPRISPRDIFDCEESDYVDCEVIAFEDVAVTEVSLAWSAYEVGMVGGGNALTAYNLGDGFWYAVQSEDMGEMYWWFTGVVPDAKADEVFAELREQWVLEHEAHRDGFNFTDLGGFDLTDPRTYRLIARKVMHEYEDGILSKHWMHEELTQYWNAAVIVEPDDQPPALDDRNTSPEFDAWVGDHTITWRDTGALLEPADAETLRTVCQFLVLKYRA